MSINALLTAAQETRTPEHLCSYIAQIVRALEALETQPYQFLDARNSDHPEGHNHQIATRRDSAMTLTEDVYRDLVTKAQELGIANNGDFAYIEAALRYYWHLNTTDLTTVDPGIIETMNQCLKILSVKNSAQTYGLQLYILKRRSTDIHPAQFRQWVINQNYGGIFEAIIEHAKNVGIDVTFLENCLKVES